MGLFLPDNLFRIWWPNCSLESKPVCGIPRLWKTLSAQSTVPIFKQAFKDIFQETPNSCRFFIPDNDVGGRKNPASPWRGQVEFLGLAITNKNQTFLCVDSAILIWIEFLSQCSQPQRNTLLFLQKKKITSPQVDFFKILNKNHLYWHLKKWIKDHFQLRYKCL